MKRYCLKSKADDFTFPSALETDAEHRIAVCRDSAGPLAHPVARLVAATGMDVRGAI